MNNLRLAALTAEVVKQIGAYMPGLKTCATHPGKINIDELSRIARKPPAVHVALMDIPALPIHTQEVETMLTLVAYVTTQDQRGLPAEQSALNLVEALLNWLPGRQFLPFAYGAERVAARNLFSASADKKGVALWGVTWRQKIRLVKQQHEPVLLERLYISDVDGGDTIVVGDDEEHF